MANSLIVRCSPGRLAHWGRAGALITLILTFNSLCYSMVLIWEPTGFFYAKERVSENIYWFQSEFYAQVTAGAIIGPQWAV